MGSAEDGSRAWPPGSAEQSGNPSSVSLSCVTGDRVPIFLSLSFPICHSKAKKIFICRVTGKIQLTKDLPYWAQCLLGSRAEVIDGPQLSKYLTVKMLDNQEVKGMLQLVFWTTDDTCVTSIVDILNIAPVTITQ